MKTSNHRRSARMLAIGVGLAATLLAGCQATPPPTPSKVVIPAEYSRLPGLWGVSGDSSLSCENNPHQISFSEDQGFMLLEYTHRRRETGERKQETKLRYRILRTSPHLRLVVEGETDKNWAGNRYAWDLLMLSPDSYCLRRMTDRPGACSPPRRRCAASP